MHRSSNFAANSSVDLDVNLCPSQAIHHPRAPRAPNPAAYFPIVFQRQHLKSLSIMSRKKSLLIGINYTGSENELRGCHQDVENVAEFLSYRGYSNDQRSQVILRDDLGGQYYPSGHNILVLNKFPAFPISTNLT
jgi:hypothetical protein